MRLSDTVPHAPRSLAAATAAGLCLALLPAAGGAAQHGTDGPRGIDHVCDEVDADDNPYRDVSSQNVHVRAIVCATETGIAHGYDDGTYRPGDPVTRQQLASFLAEMVEQERPLFEGDGEFDDVHPHSPHARAIDALAASEVVEGRDEDTFAPRERVRRDQVASLVARAMDFAHNGAVDGSAPPPATDGPYFPDLPRDNPHAEAIDALAEQGVVAGDAEAAYEPAGQVRRDQLASALMRGYDHLEERLQEDPPAH